MSVNPLQGIPRCDHTKLRRSQRAFRMTVTLLLVLTAAWWFSESYLRYDHSETQYRMALTLQRAQARPILRTVVERESKEKDTPSALYFEALAEVEEADKLLPAYARAYQSNPKSESLLINYGCRLYEMGQYGEARERFREAGINPPRNLLPRYLESAALLASSEGKEERSNALALIARANASGDPLLVPEPLWHDSLPRHGKGYLHKYYMTADRIFEAIHNSALLFCAALDREATQGNAAELNGHLEKLETMSMRLLGMNKEDSPPALRQLEHALQIQLTVLQQRGRLADSFGLPAVPEYAERSQKLLNLLRELDQFNASGDALAQKYARRLLIPFVLILESVALFTLFYLALLLLRRFLKPCTHLPFLPVTGTGKKLLFAGFTALFLLLLLMPALYSTNREYVWEYPMQLLGEILCAGLLLFFGIYYPLSTLRAFLKDARRHELQEAWVEQKKLQLSIFSCLALRYAGFLLGGLIICVCLWLDFSRIFYSAYPFQSALLPSGLEADIGALVNSIKDQIKSF